MKLTDWRGGHHFMNISTGLGTYLARKKHAIAKRIKWRDQWINHPITNRGGHA